MRAFLFAIMLTAIWPPLTSKYVSWAAALSVNWASHRANLHILEKHPETLAHQGGRRATEMDYFALRAKDVRRPGSGA